MDKKVVNGGTVVGLTKKIREKQIGDFCGGFIFSR